MMSPVLVDIIQHTFFEMRQQCFDKAVYGGTGFDEEHNSAGTFQKRTQFFDRMGSDDGFAFMSMTTMDFDTFSFIFHEMIDFGDGTVEGGDGESYQSAHPK
jgi:hypothetical protein